MRHFAIALAFFSLAALTATGQQTSGVNVRRSNIKNNIQVLPGPDGKVHCTFSVSGKTAACTASEIAQLNAALAKGSAVPGAAKTGVKSVALAKDGSLMCTTGSGTGPCTATHLTDLKQADSRVNSEPEQATGDPAPQK